MGRLRVTFLGTGTSHGVPMIACDCPVCRSNDEKNKRTRTSILVSYNGRNILVDTTPELRIQAIRCNVRRVDAVLFTHHHADHSGGCQRIKDIIPAKVYLHQEGAELVEEGDEEKMGLVVAKKSGFYSPRYTFTPFKVDCRVKDNEEISVGKLKLKAFHTPGHSKDSTCFYIDREGCRILFSGDVVLFEGKIALLNLRGSNLEDYRKNFSKITSLEVDALLPGHGVFVLKEGKQHIDRASLAPVSYTHLTLPTKA